jgi:ribosome-binding factor A
MTSRRSDRVADLIKEEIASMLLRGEIKDPRVGFVTITGVKLTEDLKSAKVFFSSIESSGEGSVENIKRGLMSAVPYIRRALAKRLRLRHIPEVSFEFDRSLEYAARIEEVLKKIKEGG